MMNVAVDGKATLCCADIDASVPVGDALAQDLLSIGGDRRSPVFASCIGGATSSA